MKKIYDQFLDDINYPNIDLPIKYKKHVYFTNNHIAIRVPVSSLRETDYPEFSTQHSIAKQLMEWMQKAKVSELLDLSKITIPNTIEYKNIKCDCYEDENDHCEGCLCNTSYDPWPDCLSCKGSGFYEKIGKESTLIEKVYFDSFYLEIISQLPNVKINSNPKEGTCCFFQFDVCGKSLGWGLVMPISGGPGFTYRRRQNER